MTERKQHGSAMLVGVLPVAVVLVWFVSAVLLRNPAFPTPLEATASLADSLGSARFRAAVVDTATVAAGAFAVALAVGVVVGCAFALLGELGKAAGSILYIFNSVPKIVLFPVFLLGLGLNTTSRFAFGVFHGVFIIAIVMMEAARGLDPRLGKIAKAMLMTRTQQIRLIVLPALLPYLAVGARLCFSLTFLGVVVAELLSASGGLGGQILHRVEVGRVDEICGIVVLVVVMALLPVVLIEAIERRIMRKRTPGVR